MPALDAGIFFLAMGRVEHGHDERNEILDREDQSDRK